MNQITVYRQLFFDLHQFPRGAHTLLFHGFATHKGWLDIEKLAKRASLSVRMVRYALELLAQSDFLDTMPKGRKILYKLKGVGGRVFQALVPDGLKSGTIAWCMWVYGQIVETPSSLIGWWRRMRKFYGPCDWSIVSKIAKTFRELGVWRRYGPFKQGLDRKKLGVAQSPRLDGAVGEPGTVERSPPLEKQGTAEMEQNLLQKAMSTADYTIPGPRPEDLRKPLIAEARIRFESFLRGDGTNLEEISDEEAALLLCGLHSCVRQAENKRDSPQRLAPYHFDVFKQAVAIVRRPMEAGLPKQQAEFIRYQVEEGHAMPATKYLLYCALSVFDPEAYGTGSYELNILFHNGPDESTWQRANNYLGIALNAFEKTDYNNITRILNNVCAMVGGVDHRATEIGDFRI